MNERLQVSVYIGALCIRQAISSFRLFFHEFLHLRRTHLGVVGNTPVHGTGNNAVCKHKGECDEECR